VDEIVGAFVTVAIGVIVVGAIYQLGKSANPIVPDATSVANTTLNSLFK
jgi:hypothetical protein